MLKLALLFVLFNCLSCQSSPQWQKDCKRIAAKPAIIDVYECKEKANEYKAIYGGKILHVSTERLGYPNDLHAVNEVNGYIIDCSFGFWKKIKKINYETTQKTWGHYFAIQ